MHETDLQHTEIVPYFCREENNGGLGYRETSNNYGHGFSSTEEEPKKRQ